MRPHYSLLTPVWRDLTDSTHSLHVDILPWSDHEESGRFPTLSETIESVAPLYFDPRFGCFVKSIYRRVNGSFPVFRHQLETITRADGVHIAGEIEKSEGPSNWRDFLLKTPTPGFFYRIRWGDTLTGVARKAYGRTPWGAQYINFHPFNRRLWRTDRRHKRLWPWGRVSFNPRFSKDDGKQVTTLAAVAGAPRGHSYGIIHIPMNKWEVEIERLDLTADRVDVVRFDVRKGRLELKKLSGL